MAPDRHAGSLKGEKINETEQPDHEWQYELTEWYLRKIVVMPLSNRTPPARLVRFRQIFVICSHGR